MMNCGVFKARRSQTKLSKSLQQQLLAALAKTEVESRSKGIQQPPVTGDQYRNAPVQPSKRPFNATSVTDSLPAKRPRLTSIDAPPFTVEDTGEEQEDQGTQTILQQPTPERPKHRYASFLENFAGSACSDQPDCAADLVFEWLETVGREREARCRSDSYISTSIPRQPTRSVQEMSHSRYQDGFVVPPTPASTGSLSVDGIQSDFTAATPGSGRSSGRSLVEDPLYRDINLAANNIYLRHSCDPLPENIADLVARVHRARDSPGPSSDDLKHNRDLYDLSMGTSEPEVEKYFHTHVFPDPKSFETLKRSDRQPMAKHTVPNTGSKYKVSTPVPDTLYGYNRQNAFPQQQGQLLSMGSEMVANNQGLIYPFFAIEFKGDGPSGSGSLWVATNQCLGASASCLKIAQRLNHLLRDCQGGSVQSIGNAAFGIAMSGTEARLYVSWIQNELDFHMANVDSFLLQKPNDYIEFRKYVRNIIDWGGDERLKEIQESLDFLLEKSRKEASAAARSRPPPSTGSNSTKKRKSSTTPSVISSRSTNIQERGVGQEIQYWELDPTSERWFHRHANGTVTWAEGNGRS
ncbi:hypothetical protein TruAng_000152 [Truncatella angustata]|nr:hypothetical protein TruAng_000152 [Truncatella angustata]